ncbi:hypothetical protein V1477_019722, partial [Vespula maculifrons]
DPAKARAQLTPTSSSQALPLSQREIRQPTTSFLAKEEKRQGRRESSYFSSTGKLAAFTDLHTYRPIKKREGDRDGRKRCTMLEIALGFEPGWLSKQNGDFECTDRGILDIANSISGK